MIIELNNKVALAQELASKGITVNTISPGTIIIRNPGSGSDVNQIHAGRACSPDECPPCGFSMFRPGRTY